MNLMRRNAVLLVLAAGLAVPTWLQLRHEVDTFVDPGSVPLMFDGFTSDNVGSIVLGQPKAEQPAPPPGQNPDQPPPVAYDYLALQRVDQGWRIAQLPGQPAAALAGAPVQKTRVENDVFQHLRSIRVDEQTIVQPDATAEQLAERGLDDAHAFLVRVVDQSGQHVLAELLVGENAGGGQAGTEAVRGVYVRQKGSADVVLYELPGMWRRDVDPALWLDRTLARITPSTVRRVSIRNGSTGAQPFVFARETGEASWQLASRPDGARFERLGALRQIEVDNLLRPFQYLMAQSFERPLARAGDMAALGLFPPQIQVALTIVEDGRERVFELNVGGRADDRNEHWLTTSDSQFLMTWSVSSVTAFELDVAQRLFDPAPEPPKDPPKDGK